MADVPIEPSLAIFEQGCSVGNAGGGRMGPVMGRRVYVRPHREPELKQSRPILNGHRADTHAVGIDLQCHAQMMAAQEQERPRGQVAERRLKRVTGCELRADPISPAGLPG
jgi:hypothetical protein